MVSLAVAEAAAELSVVQVLSAASPDSFLAAPVPQLDLEFGGIRGDRHFGLTRPSGSREARCYPRGTTILNRRQVTLVSAEELAHVASRLQVPEIRAEWLGANLLVAGLPALSALPAGTRLLFPSGAGLVCTGVNQPCRQPAQVVQEHYPQSTALRQFVRAAMGRRGIAASVECPGLVRPFDRAIVVPPERHVVID